MNVVNRDWTPGFGTIYTWFAMDKHGRIAVMVNNCWGWLPDVLLSLEDFESVLDDLNEYKLEESDKYTKYPGNKKGQTILDLYSSAVYRHIKSREEVASWVNAQQTKDLNEVNIPSRKGFFVYHGVEGSREGEDYPVGYEGETRMGDYFRYLMPTIFASIEDFPQELRQGIAVSSTVDFSFDRVLNNNLINTFFPKMYQN